MSPKCMQESAQPGGAANLEHALCTSETPVSLMRLCAFLGRTPPPAMTLMRPCACLTNAARAVLPCTQRRHNCLVCRPVCGY